MSYRRLRARDQDFRRPAGGGAAVRSRGRRGTSSSSSSAPRAAARPRLCAWSAGSRRRSSGQIRLEGDRRRAARPPARHGLPVLLVVPLADGRAATSGSACATATTCRRARRRERAGTISLWSGSRDFADVYPNRISGGMRQRVAIARTLAAGSDVLLMDEPFGALDAQTRECLQVELRRIQQSERKTIIFVTHDVEEAVFLADRIIVFSPRPARIVSEIDVRVGLRPRAPARAPRRPRNSSSSAPSSSISSAADRGQRAVSGIDLSGRTVLVTGASRGIGLGIAAAFAAAGADLHILADDAAIEDARREARRDAAMSPTSPRALRSPRCSARIPKLDVLVNNAGLERMTPIEDGSDENEAVFRRIIDDQRHRHVPRDPRGAAADGRGRRASSTPPRSGAASPSRCSRPMSPPSTR